MQSFGNLVDSMYLMNSALYLNYQKLGCPKHLRKATIEHLKKAYSDLRNPCSTPFVHSAKF